MTNQEAFTKAYIGARKQNFERSFKGPRCLYRGPDNRKCLIGHLIDDETALDADQVIIQIFDICRKIDLNVQFAIQLRECHDQATTPNDVKINLKQFAVTHELVIPV